MTKLVQTDVLRPLGSSSKGVRFSFSRRPLFVHNSISSAAGRHRKCNRRHSPFDGVGKSNARWLADYVALPAFGIGFQSFLFVIPAVVVVVAPAEHTNGMSGTNGSPSRTNSPDLGNKSTMAWTRSWPSTSTTR